MTISEEHFERFCRENDICFERLSPDGQETPDYRIVMQEKPMVVEVKELTLNDEEEQALRDVQDGCNASWGPKRVGDRIRYKLSLIHI